MGMFELQGDDGATYEVDAPDAAKAVAAFKKLQARNAPPPDPNAGQRPLGLEPDMPAMPVTSQREVAGALAKGAEQGGDVAPSFASGLVRGTTGTLGSVVDFSDWIGRKRDQYITNPILRAIGQKELDANAPGPLTPYLGSAALQQGVENYVTGPMHQPTTTTGKYAERVGEFVPGAAIGSPAAIGRNVVRYGVLPAIASEAAGQATEGTPLEPYARVGAALATGGGAAFSARPNPGAAIVAREARELTPQQLAETERLFAEGQQPGMIPVSRGEAAGRATQGASGLPDVQHTVEGLGGMKEFYAGRPAAVEAAGQTQLGNIAEPSNPFTVGPAAAETANASLDQIRRRINSLAEPYYNASRQTPISRGDYAALQATPGYDRALAAVRADEVTYHDVIGLPDNSVGVLGAVKENLDASARQADNALNPLANHATAAGYSQSAATVARIGERVDPNYGRALEIGEEGRRRVLEPLTQGPLGNIAKRPETQAAAAALFDNQAGSEVQVAQTVRTMAARNPEATARLVRSYAEELFNATAGKGRPGGNQGGAAQFAARLHGQAGINMTAALTELRGAGMADGWNRFVELADTTGYRQAMGSRTAFKGEDIAALRQGGPVMELGKGAATGGIKYPQMIKDRLDRWNLGQNLDEVARLMTDPRAAREFRELANSPSGSARAAYAFGRLVNMAGRGADGGRNEITVTPRRP